MNMTVLVLPQLSASSRAGPFLQMEPNTTIVQRFPAQQTTRPAVADARTGTCTQSAWLAHPLPGGTVLLMLGYTW
jgi:hypothetical protein